MTPQDRATQSILRRRRRLCVRVRVVGLFRCIVRSSNRARKADRTRNKQRVFLCCVVSCGGLCEMTRFQSSVPGTTLTILNMLRERERDRQRERGGRITTMLRAVLGYDLWSRACVRACWRACVMDARAHDCVQPAQRMCVPIDCANRVCV